MWACGIVKGERPVVRILNEETEQQRQRLADARSELGDALSQLSTEAKKASSSCASKRAVIDLDRVYAAVLEVRRREEAVDLSALDLQTASGEDA